MGGLNRSRIIHNFVIADCSAMAEGVADRLFYGSIDEVREGKEKGRPGFFDLADKGTLFLDDISRLPMAVEKSIHGAIKKYEIPSKGVSPECLDILLAYDWPGNGNSII